MFCPCTNENSLDLRFESNPVFVCGFDSHFCNLVFQKRPLHGLLAEEFNLFQGRDKECIIVSFVRSTANSRACGSSLLGDWHRINVLLTRAKVTCSECGSLYQLFPQAVFF